MTNLAFQEKTIYVTDSANGEIVRATMPVAGPDSF
jgi:hypothetical protein